MSPKTQGNFSKTQGNYWKTQVFGNSIPLCCRKKCEKKSLPYALPLRSLKSQKKATVWPWNEKCYFFWGKRGFITHDKQLGMVKTSLKQYRCRKSQSTSRSTAGGWEGAVLRDVLRDFLQRYCWRLVFTMHSAYHKGWRQLDPKTLLFYKFGSCRSGCMQLQ